MGSRPNMARIQAGDGLVVLGLRFGLNDQVQLGSSMVATAIRGGAMKFWQLEPSP